MADASMIGIQVTRMLIEARDDQFIGHDGAEIHPDWCRECRVTALQDQLARAVDEGNSIAVGLLGQWINGERGHPGYPAARPRWMAEHELQRRCDDVATWRESWRVATQPAQTRPLTDSAAADDGGE